MLFPITTITWQQLRVLVRAKGKPVRGTDLRYSPTRFTKTGEFLTRLVEVGLIERRTGDERAPFEATYALTEKGHYAAEHGEYDRGPRSSTPESHQ